MGAVAGDYMGAVVGAVAGDCMRDLYGKICMGAVVGDCMGENRMGDLPLSLPYNLPSKLLPYNLPY